ncbi:MAG TPA: CdaR family protein [Bryobacteraceae bacterium]|nr:CdaR family protein [Bryobacteraceae bacterium]
MKRLFRGLARNWRWKLGALGFSVLIWFTTVGEPEMVTTRSVSILYKDLRPDLSIGPDTPGSVRVELRGPASKLTASSLTDLAIVLDVSDVQAPGQKTFSISSADLHLPQGVTFLRAVPSQLRVRLASGNGGL